MKKIITTSILICIYGVSFADFKAVIPEITGYQIGSGTTNPPVIPPVTPPVTTPGGCELTNTGSHIFKIKNVGSSNWEGSFVGQFGGEWLYSSDYISLFETSNLCWGNDPSAEIDIINFSTSRPPFRKEFKTSTNKQWNNSNTLYLRFVGQNFKTITLQNTPDELGKYTVTNDNADLKEWTEHIKNNKLFEYSIEVSEKPY